MVSGLVEMNSGSATHWMTIGSMNNEDNAPAQNDGTNQEPELVLADESYTCVMRPPGSFGTDPNGSDESTVL